MAGAEKRVALVTGAAGDIGLAIVRCLIRDGWRICATSLELTAELQTVVGDQGICVEGNLTDPADVEAVIARAIQEEGRLDGLVNCAGASMVAAFHEQSNDDWSRFLDINLDAAYFVAREFAKSCLNQPQSDRSVVLISSLAAIAGGANPAYGAAKAGVCALVYNMAQTYAGTGLRANAVLPGIIDTQMVRNAFEGEKFEALKQAASARTPVGRLGTPEDVAELCAFLLSERSTFITGQTINVTGGLELLPPIGKI